MRPPIVWSSSSVHCSLLVDLVCFSKNLSVKLAILYCTSYHSVSSLIIRNGDVVEFCARSLMPSSIAVIAIGCSDGLSGCSLDFVVSSPSPATDVSVPLLSVISLSVNSMSQASSSRKSTSIHGITIPFRRNPGPSISWRNIANKVRALLLRMVSSNKQIASIAAATCLFLFRLSPLTCHTFSSSSGTPSKVKSCCAVSHLQHRLSNSSSSSSSLAKTATILPAITCNNSSCSSVGLSCCFVCHSSTACCAIFPAE